jgi:hypothetical protein
LTSGPLYGYNGTHLFIGNGWWNYVFQTDMQSAEILPNGELSAWTAQPNTLMGICNGSTNFFFYNDRIYLAGGATASWSLNDVESATVSGGTIGNWSYMSNLPVPVRGSTVYVIGDHAYLIGQTSSGAEGANGPWTSGILIGDFQPNGDIFWSTFDLGTDYSLWGDDARTSFIYNNSIYVMTSTPFVGNCNSSTDCSNLTYKLLKLDIQPDGSLTKTELPDQLQDLPKSTRACGSAATGTMGWKAVVWNENLVIAGSSERDCGEMKVLVSPILSPTRFGPAYEISSVQVATADLKMTSAWAVPATLIGDYIYIHGMDGATGTPEEYSAKLSF